MLCGLNAAEQFVAQHCKGTFLSLWGMGNPVGRDQAKELCDYLVVCDPHILIVSVKEVRLDPEPDQVKADRWRRKAVNESIKQVYGAERYLESLGSVQDRTGRTLVLPPSNQRRIYRICVAFGSQGRVGVPMGDFGKGFVHVLDETSFPTLLRELDTVSDLTAYLEAKRTFLEGGRRAIIPGEEQLLAFYLSNARSFFLSNARSYPNGPDLILLDETLWSSLVQSEQFRAREEANKTSYAWDQLIEHVSRDLMAGNMMYVDPPTEGEVILRILVHENRSCGSSLAEAMVEVFIGGKVRARMVQFMSGIVYVFVALSRDEDRTYRRAELGARCLVARSHHRNARTVVGIATERANDGVKGCSFDLFTIDKPEWTEEDEKLAAYAREEFGFFKSPVVSVRNADAISKSVSV